jgi:hypothetical protein
MNDALCRHASTLKIVVPSKPNLVAAEMTGSTRITHNPL